jgi:c-di-AMP phosphodiesterase-like protein
VEISNKPKAKDAAIPELDVYLGVMLLGIVCIFASIIHNRQKLKVYTLIVAIGAILYLLYMLRSYIENRKNISEKEALDKDLKEAEEYKVTT